MEELSNGERIASALQALAADLVTERRRLRLLRRENHELRAQLDALRSQRRGTGAPPPADRPRDRDRDRERKPA